jgi:hypothetical protein
MVGFFSSHPLFGYSYERINRVARSLANPQTSTAMPAGISKHEEMEMGAN